jgi:hypothetical protein
MNRTLIFLTVLILLLNFQIAVGQDFTVPTNSDYPKLPEHGRSIEDFVPKDWKIVAKALGDLNADSSPDCALVIKANDAKFLNKNDGLGVDVYDTNPRVLIILFKDKEGYKIAGQSNTFIKTPDSPTMSEPFQTVKIRNGILQMDFEQWYSAGSWAASQYLYKFKFLNKKFVLIGADKTESMRNSGSTETRSYNFLTNKVKITIGNFATDDKKRVRWKTYKLKKLKTLDTFKEPFSWEIESDYYI